MDLKTVFTIISLTILANGTVLAISYLSLAEPLRPAARMWQWGTLLIAAGCALFAFGQILPRPAMLTLANGSMTFGLASYTMALRSAHGLRYTRRLYWPAVGATLGVFWFSAVVPDFKIRVIIVSLAWLVLALAAVHALTRRPAPRLSSSRNLLIVLLALLAMCVMGQLAVYLSPDIPNDFVIESAASGWNLVCALVLTMLPIVGTTAFLMLCSDVLRAKLEHTAATDFLTGLPNRRSVTQRGNSMFAEAVESATGFAVAVLDIDSFKALNDQYGHEAGDHALVHIANSLRQETRASDMVARSGGEEFTMLLHGLDAANALAAAERMRIAIEKSNFRWKEEPVPITISSGVATRGNGDNCFEDIVRRADQALYRAKAKGRNRVDIA